MASDFSEPNSTPSTKQSMIRYYNSRQSVGVWGALVAGLSIITGGASLAAHSFAVTSGLLVGAVAVWYVGYWFLSKSVYFASDSKAGFKDAFRAREVSFDEIESASKDVSRDSVTLTFVCKTRTVRMPIDTFDESWFSAVKAELQKRGIPFSVRAYGFAMKEKNPG